MVKFLKEEELNLEPDLEVESSARVTGSMEKAESDATVDATTEKNSHLESFLRPRHH